MLTLLSYAYFLPRVFSKQPVSALWFGIDGWLRSAYYVSIVFAAVAFVVMSVWMLYRPPSDVSATRLANETCAVVCFFTGAVLWSVTLWIWGSAVRGRWGSVALHVAKGGVFVALLLTTIGVLWLIIEWLRTSGGNRTRSFSMACTPHRQMSTPVPWWVFLCAGYVLWHVGVLDNIGWSIAFLGRSTMHEHAT